MIPFVKPTIIRGIQTEGRHQYPYVGLAIGKYQYRIYSDREGWFVNGGWEAVPPKGGSANQIRQALKSAGKQAFLEFLAERLEKWKLKEMAGI
jgi:hypothetical protein